MQKNKTKQKNYLLFAFLKFFTICEVSPTEFRPLKRLEQGLALSQTYYAFKLIPFKMTIVVNAPLQGIFPCISDIVIVKHLILRGIWPS